MFRIDVMSRIPIYEQLVQQVESYVLNGILTKGEKLPSVRSLSLQLSVNPNTIQKAMTELDRRGIAQSVPGRGCFIAEDALDHLRARRGTMLSDVKKQLQDMKLAGVPREEVLHLVEEVYQEEGEE